MELSSGFIKKTIILTTLCIGFINVSLFGQYKLSDERELSDLNEIIFGQIIDFKIIENHIFVTDFKGPQIYKFSLDGKLLRSTGRSGRGPGEFEYGPRHIVYNKGLLYVTSMLPLVKIYNMDLEFIEHKRFIDFASNIHGLHSSNSGEIIIVPTQFYEESILTYNTESEEKESVFLNFEIVSGLLSKYDIYPFGDKWLFAWEFQNRFELYDSSFSKISSFKLPELPEKAEGTYSETPIIPKEANSYRVEMYKKGGFFPHGTFFTSITKLDESHLLVQLGFQTGGYEKAIIVDIKGRIKQEIELPKKKSIILAYHDNILFMHDRGESRTVFAYEFKED